MNTDDSIVNTNACIKATRSSRIFMNMVKTTETKVMAVPIYLLTDMVMNIMQTKARITVCPARIFAKRRIVKAKGLTNIPNISITGIIGTGNLRKIGTSGQKISL